MNSGFNAHCFQELAPLEAANFWFRSRNRLILWALRRYAPRLGSFLEIGCGTGFVIASVAQHFPAAKLQGSEFFEEGLVFARQRVPGAEFVQMDARHIPYESEWEVIGAFDVIEHIEEDETVLRQVYKALRPGGYIYITVPQHRWLWSRADEAACHVRRYNRSELVTRVEQAGFRVIMTASFVTLLLPLMLASRLLRRSAAPNFDPMAELRLGRVANWALGLVMHVEYTLIRMGLRLPLGGSLLLVARKPVS